MLLKIYMKLLGKFAQGSAVGWINLSIMPSSLLIFLSDSGTADVQCLKLVKGNICMSISHFNSDVLGALRV